MSNKAVVLLSGGLDSSTLTAYLQSKGMELYAITMQYGQVHKKEVESAIYIAKKYNVKEHKIININMNEISKSALTDSSISIPENREYFQDIPVTYVPARNIIFLSIALSYAESKGIDNIAIGANSIDYSGYPDCRDEFFKSYEKMANVGTKYGVEGGEFKIIRPLIDMSKKDIVLLGNSLKVPFEHTWSCYKGQDVPCGVCDSCKLRHKGFEEAGVKDPLENH